MARPGFAAFACGEGDDVQPGVRATISAALNATARCELSAGYAVWWLPATSLPVTSPPATSKTTSNSSSDAPVATGLAR
jgi:hypothetical protein